MSTDIGKIKWNLEVSQKMNTSIIKVVLMFPSYALILFTSLLFKPLILSINGDRYFVARETLSKSRRELQHEEPYQTH